MYSGLDAVSATTRFRFVAPVLDRDRHSSLKAEWQQLVKACILRNFEDYMHLIYSR